MLKNHEINALTEQEAEESRKKVWKQHVDPAGANLLLARIVGNLP